MTDAQGKSQALSASHIILATGAKARHIPQLPVDGTYVWSYKEALIPEELPKAYSSLVQVRLVVSLPASIKT